MSDASEARPPRGDDPAHLGAAAAAYLRAAARLAEASVLVRLLAGTVDNEGNVSGEAFDEFAAAAASALEAAASEYEIAADIMSRTRWGVREDMVPHVESLRAAVRALNIDAAQLLDLVAEDNGERGDGGGADPDDDPGEDQPPSLREQLLDRAATFRMKVTLMTESSAVILAGAHEEAARPI